MPCNKPIYGWPAAKRNKNGKRPIVFQQNLALQNSRQQPVPCGQCMGCRLDKAREWAMRCHFENQQHSESCFLTLTYSDEHLPLDTGLEKRHFQLFIKKLRHRIERQWKKQNPWHRLLKHYPQKVFWRKKLQNITPRYFMAGEYGGKNGRPHYHACLFGYRYPDMVLYNERENYKLYTSEIATKEWGLGECILGEITYESAAYVAGYTISKITGKNENEEYQNLDLESGEIFTVQPPYAAMSLKPAIGKTWFNKFKTDCYPKDFVTINGRKQKPPRFFDEQLRQYDEEMHQAIKVERVKQALNKPTTETQRRARERIREKHWHTKEGF